MMNLFLCASIVLTIFPGAVTGADKLYRQGEYEQAAQKYRQALKSGRDSAIIEFNLGAALYKQELYPEAAEHFQRALLSDDSELRKKAHYNLGNTFYRRGIEQETQDLDAAVRQLERSLDHLKQSLKIAPDPDTEHNLEFVQKELERLKQKKQQQEENRQQQEKSQQKKNGQDQSKNENRQQDRNGQKPEKKEPGDAGQQPREQEEKPGDEQAGDAGEQTREGQTQEDQQESGGAEQDDQQSPAPSFVSGTAAGPAEDLNEREARELIEEYQQNEKPGQLMNFLRAPRRPGQPPVLKDW